MKRIWIGLLLLALLLAGCGEPEADLHPEWPEAWLRFGNLMAMETPADFTLGEYNDVLSPEGIWYVMFNCGSEPKTLPGEKEGEETVYYDAQLFLVLKECGSEAEARANVRDWEAREGQNYTMGDRRELDAAEQSFAFYPLLSGREGNPYTHGAAAFAVRGELAISAELLCTEDFAGDPQAILEQFLNGIHYGE